MLPNLNITLIQSDIKWADKSANILKFDKIISNLENPTDLIVLPEMFTTGFITNPKELAEPIESHTLEWMSKKSVQTNAVITGSFIVVDNSNFYNCLVWMQPNGIYKQYFKRHLFRMGDENKYFTRGNEKIIVDLLGWKICPLICYDLRFPVWSKNTYKDGVFEYDLLIYVANWSSARSNVFRKLLQARAIENLSYVVGVNRVGTDGHGVYYQGNSAIIDFKGNYITEIANDKEEVISNFIDYNQLQNFRDNFNVGLDWDDFIIIKK